jgi:uncharacterized protein (TIGR02246 family)
MKRQTKAAFVCTVLFIFCLALNWTTCAHHPEAPSIDLAKEEQAIRDISMKWLEFANARDVSNTVMLFAEDGVVYRQNQEPIVGRDAIQNLFTKENKQNPKSVFSWNTDRVEIAASGDLAVEYGTWSESGSGMDGIEAFNGKFVTVYRKIDDVWKVISDIGVSTNPENDEL